jgi:hypothetical protein
LAAASVVALEGVAVPSLILHADAARDELRASFSAAVQAGEWRGDDDLKMLVSPDGKVVELVVRGYRRWARNRIVLVDLIARTMNVHRDEVMSLVAALPF